MRKFHTAISFMIIIAVTVVVIGLFALNRPKTQSTRNEPVQQQTESIHPMLLCI